MSKRLALSVFAALALCTLLISGLAAGDKGDEQTLSLGAVAQIVDERYAGRMLRIRSDTPRPHERRAGAALIHEVTWLTPQEAVIRVRIDAVTGAFLTIEGAGQVAARRRE